MRKKIFIEESRTMFSMTFWLLSLLVPIQIFLGDMHGLNTFKYQPAKLAAIEAHWTPEKRAPLILFAIPDQQKETNHAVVEVPLLGSIILTHDINGEVPGLKTFPADDRAPVVIPFFSFRIMVGLGLLMLGIIVLSVWLRIRKRLFKTEWFLKLCQYSAPIGFLTVIAGWVTTEVGRQPWTVYGLLRTAHSVSPSLTGADVILSLMGYMLVYLIIFPVGILLMARVVRKGPADAAHKEPVEGGQPSKPILTPPEYTHHDH
jgi:cytochrome d ubiquinol oxidase subunit I